MISYCPGTMMPAIFSSSPQVSHASIKVRGNFIFIVVGYLECDQGLILQAG
jgi:hypothetical protein